MTMLTVLTVASLLIVMTLCIAALFSRYFLDNWLQHVGLIGIGTTSAMLAEMVVHAEYVPPQMALMAISLAVYALGTAYKVWRYRNCPQPDWGKKPVHKLGRKPDDATGY
jgi:hypothetical protein